MSARVWACRGRRLQLTAPPLIMGIVNVTPDSFSDGGVYFDLSRAVDHALQLVDAGADIVDVGGESTRPGAARVDAAEERRRVVPVIEQISAQSDVTISVDTSKADVADAALDAGAHIINDVSALTCDPEMATVACKQRAGIVLMHMRGTPQTMQTDLHYADVVDEVHAYLVDRVKAALDAGIDNDALVVDPGIGFGKSVQHNLQLVANVDAWRVTGIPALVGLSRKRFIGAITGAPVEDRLAGSLSALVSCVMAGVEIMRVHDVADSVQAVSMVRAIEAERQ